MAQRWLLVVCLVLAMGAANSAQDQTPLEGAWEVISSAFDGQVRPSENQIILTFHCETYTQTVDGSINERGTIKLDQTKRPMLVDFVLSEPKMTQLGVVEIAGETLRLHVNRGTAVRPTDLNPAPENFFIVARKLTPVGAANAGSSRRKFWIAMTPLIVAGVYFLWLVNYGPST